jgi:uncharacterized radical SAM superfamily protein
MKKLVSFIVLLGILVSAECQQNDSLFIAKAFQSAISNHDAMKMLKHLCDSAPGRLLGSENSIKAVMYLKKQVDRIKPDTCYLQEYKTHAWEHISTQVSIIEGKKKTQLHALALGPSVSTDGKAVLANVIEVSSFAQFDSLKKEQVEGRIVFFNHEMSNNFTNPSQSYGEAFPYRYISAIKASAKGAKAVLIRSLTQVIDTFPHTGKTTYADTVAKVPIAALSTYDCELLHSALKVNSALKISMDVQTRDINECTSYNIIADIKGSEFPDKYILIGAHIDTWYNTSGAHDDGAGCVQVLEIMRIMKELGYKNKCTFRFVFFMDEELFQTGAKAYSAYTSENKLQHIAAIETDAGGFAPRAFAVDAPDSIVNHLQSFIPLFKPYGLYSIYAGGTDADIQPLKKFNVPLIGNKPLSQRYFDIHHSGFDTFNQVNFREMQMATTTMVGLMYLLDKSQK